MRFEVRRFPWFVIKPIPGCHETKQFFLLPGILIGKGFFTVFWIRTMLTVTFNTTLIKE